MYSHPSARSRIHKKHQRCIHGAVLFLLLIAFVSGTPLMADSIAANESQTSSADTEAAIQAFLKKFDPENYSKEEETDGFDFLYTSNIFSAFDYQIYGGRISSRIDKTIVRVEGDTGDVNTIARILELENILVQGSTVPLRGEASELELKSHLIGQSINFVAPWMAVWYNSYRSPRLGFAQTWFRMGMYLLADGLMVLAGGTKFFAEGFDSSANGGLIAGALLLPRIVGAVQTANLTRGHNRLVEFKYTFYLD